LHLHPVGSSRFVRACLRQPVDRTPVWFLRQAGRYMPEYMAVRRHHSLLDICRTPQIAAEVTITAAERLGVDAAIIFADLLLRRTGRTHAGALAGARAGAAHGPRRRTQLCS
jgi:uroporphyrinogen decarboxylase